MCIRDSPLPPLPSLLFLPHRCSLALAALSSLLCQRGIKHCAREQTPWICDSTNQYVSFLSRCQSGTPWNFDGASTAPLRHLRKRWKNTEVIIVPDWMLRPDRDKIRLGYHKRLGSKRPMMSPERTELRLGVHKCLGAQDALVAP